MNIEIKEFLHGQDTPDNIDFYENVSSLLVTLGQTEFAGVVDELMMITGTTNVESFVDRYRQLLEDTTDIVIQDHGLVCNPDTPLRTKALLLEFFIQIEKTELIDECDKLLQSDETDNVELFGEVVALVIGCQAEDIMLMMAAVPESVIANMRAYISQRCEMELAMESIDDEQIRTQFKQLEQYCRLMKAQETAGYRVAFGPDGRVGDPMGQLFQMHMQDMNRTSVPAFAKELMALSLCSDGWNNPLDTINKCISTITSDLRELSEIRAALETELGAWQYMKHKDDNHVKG